MTIPTPTNGVTMPDAPNAPTSPNPGHRVELRMPTPGLLVQPMFAQRLVPSPQWIEANRAALEAGTANPPTEDDCVLEILIVAVGVKPSVLSPDQSGWPRGMKELRMIAQIPYAEFREEIEAQIERRPVRAVATATVSPPPSEVTT